MEGKQNWICLHPKVKYSGLKQMKCKLLLRIQVLWDVMLCFGVCKRWWRVCHEDAEGNDSIASLSVNFGTRWRRVVNVMLQPPYYKQRTPVSIEYEVGCIPGPVWICLEMEKSLSRMWIPFFISVNITNKMQRYTMFFITVNALHVSGSFSAHHQELKNCRHSAPFLSSWWWAEKPPETCRALTVIKSIV